MDLIPEMEKEMAAAMWEAVQQKVDEIKGETLTPPMSFMDGNQYLGDNCVANSINRCTASQPPLRWGEYNANKVPTLFKPRTTNLEKDNLHSLMSSLVICIMPLQDLLKAKPELWAEVAKCLQNDHERHSQKETKLKLSLIHI